VSALGRPGRQEFSGARGNKRAGAADSPTPNEHHAIFFALFVLG
jgi:hypothetical protein